MKDSLTMNEYLVFVIIASVIVFIAKLYDFYRFHKTIADIAKNVEVDVKARVEQLVTYMSSKGYLAAHGGSETKFKFVKRKRFGVLISLILLLLGVFLWPFLILFALHIVFHLAKKDSIKNVELQVKASNEVTV